MKTCRVCKLDKNKEEFAISKKRPDGLNLECKKCKNEYNRNHYAQNKNYYVEKAKRNNEAYNERVYSWRYEYMLHSGGCSWVDFEGKCNVINPIMLEFDHIDREQKSYNISEMMSRGMSLKLIQKEVKKCRVLCSNHHKLHTAEQFGWRALFY